MTVIQMSVSAAIFIVAIIIVRMIFLHRLNQKTFQVLWGIAVCRLLLPFSVPFKFSVFSLANRVAVTPPSHANVTAGQQFLTEIAGNIDVQTTTKFPVITIIWLVGALVLVAYFIVTHLKCRRVYNAALPIDSFVNNWQQIYHTKRTVRIKQCDQISSPLTYGIFRPIILLPNTLDFNDTNTIHYVLAHEYAHIKQLDLVKKYLLILCLCVHWFNPLVWVMCLLANQDIEISCDQTVVQSLGNEIKSSYANTLVYMEQHRFEQTHLCNNFSNNSTRERIIAIMKMKKLSKTAVACAALLIVGTSAVFATSATTVDERTKANEDNIYFVTSQGGTVQMSEAQYKEIIGGTNVQSNYQKSPLSDFASEINEITTIYQLAKGIVGEHDISVGETAIYTPANAKGLSLKQGDERTISLSMFDRKFEHGQGLAIGYSLNGKRIQLFEGQVKKGKDVKLTVPVDGEYLFYIECVSSDPLLVEMISIT